MLWSNDSAFADRSDYRMQVVFLHRVLDAEAEACCARNWNQYHNGDFNMTHDSSSGLYLEDLAVEQEFLSGEYTLDAEHIIAFASAYDPQPFHTDPEAAKNTFFQEQVASGWHTMAITMRLVVESVPLAHGIIGVNGTVSWPRPTRPGDTLHVKSRIAEIIPSRSKPDRAIVRIHSLTFNQADEVVLDFSTKALVFSKADAR